MGVSAAALAEHLVRVEIGHLVSSGSMVSRAYIVDGCVGVVVDAGERDLWLASVLPVLAPDPDGLRVRAFEKGGIPVEHGNPRLTKITLRWTDSSVDLNNPTVVAGTCGIGVVSLAVPASFGEKVRSGDGPRPLQLGDDVDLSLGDEVAVIVSSEEGPLVRWAKVSSDAGFAGRGVALDVGLDVESTGSPVFFLGGDEPKFCGIVDSLDETTSVLLPISALVDAIPTE